MAETEDLLRDKWPAPQDNPYNTPERLREHLKRTGGKVITRFPPEPNVRSCVLWCGVVVSVCDCCFVYGVYVHVCC